MPIASLACVVSVYSLRGSSAGEFLLAVPFWPFLSPFPFKLAYGVAKGKCATENARTVPVSVEVLLLRYAGFEITSQDWASLALPVYRETPADERHLPYKSV